MKGVISIIVVVFAICCEAKENDTIQLLHVFSRHGARTPEHKDVYPNDPYKLDTFLPMGWGQLTDKGKLQAYQVGKFLREKYDSFLGETYYPEMVHAQSTDFDRTKMTALLILAGMFPPSPRQTWTKELQWLPIPVAYKEHDLDYFLKRPNDYCPTYFEELKRVLHSKQVSSLLESKKNLLKYLEIHTGKLFTKLQDVFDIYQTLTAERTMNLALPEWTKSVYPNAIKELAQKQYQLENSTPLLRKLNGGRSLQKVLKNIIAKTTNIIQPENRKVFLYAGHENNILNILMSLGFYKTDFPNYGETIVIELHRLKVTDDYAVKILHIREATEAATEIQIKGCDVLCPLKKFVELTKDGIPGNYTAECKSSINLD